jgi:putative transposase
MGTRENAWPSRWHRRFDADAVLYRLTELFVSRRPPDYIRSDNGPEFTRTVREWLIRVGVKTLYIEHGSPWENGYNESFNGKLRDEFLYGEIFYTLKEAQILIALAMGMQYGKAS